MRPPLTPLTNSSRSDQDVLKEEPAHKEKTQTTDDNQTNPEPFGGTSKERDERKEQGLGPIHADAGAHGEGEYPVEPTYRPIRRRKDVCGRGVSRLKTVLKQTISKNSIKHV